MPDAISSHRTTAVWAASAGLVGVAGIAAVLVVARDKLGLLGLVHLASIAVMVTYVFWRRKAQSDASLAMIALFATAAVGPIGAFGGAALALLATRRPDLGLLRIWYDRIALSVAIDPVTRFSEDVGSGRTINLAADTPASYVDVVERGTLDERQTVLSIIARRFHPDYLPALTLALRSPEPVIRVQAAAVATHVRPDITRLYREAIADLDDAAKSAAPALALMQRIEAIVASGLLDEGERRQGNGILDRLGDVVVAGLRRRETAIPAGLPIEIEAGLVDTLERVLIGRQRFAELRTLRSARGSTVGRPHARVRRLATRPSIEARA